MTGRVIGFDGRERSAEPNAEIIECLERCLAAAKEGHIVALSIAAVETGKELGWETVKNGHFAAILAAMECAKHDLLMEAERL